MKFYTSPDFNNLPLTNVSTYDQDSINALFENLTPQELEQYSSLILDGSISSAKLWSSYKINEAIKQAVIESNEYSSDLFAKSSTFSIEYVTSLPTTDIKSNVIYILETTDASSNVIHTINFYNEATSSWVTPSSLETALSNVYTKTEVDTLLDSYPTKEEVITQDDVLTAISDTPSNDKVLSEKATKDLVDNASVKISAEADNQIEEKTDGIYVAPEEEEISWADYQALSEEEKLAKTYFIPDLPVSSSGTVIGDVEYGSYTIQSNPTTITTGDMIKFTLKDGNLSVDNDGYINLKANKVYDIKATIRCIYSTTNGYIRYILQDYNGNMLSNLAEDVCNLYSSDYAKYGCAIPLHLTIKPQNDLRVAVIINLAENISSYELPFCTMDITEIPSYQGLLECSDEHIKEVASGGIEDVPLTQVILSDETNYKTLESDGNRFGYEVINGICYVQLYMLCVSPYSDTYTPALNIFPKAKRETLKAFSPYAEVCEGLQLRIMIQNDGNVLIGGGETNKHYIVNFSYPVASN